MSKLEQAGERSTASPAARAPRSRARHPHPRGAANGDSVANGVRDGFRGFADETRRGPCGRARPRAARTCRPCRDPRRSARPRLDEPIERGDGRADVRPFRVVVEADAAVPRRRAPCDGARPRSREGRRGSTAGGTPKGLTHAMAAATLSALWPPASAIRRARSARSCVGRHRVVGEVEVTARSEGDDAPAPARCLARAHGVAHGDDGPVFVGLARRTRCPWRGHSRRSSRTGRGGRRSR